MANYLRQLSRFTTCDIADGLLNVYKISTGGYIPNLTQWTTSRPTPSQQQQRLQTQTSSVVGRAYTVLFAPSNDPRPTVNYIDSVPRDSFLVLGMEPSLQQTQAPYTTVTQAMFGGLMGTRATKLGANGAAILGRIRDINELEELQLPVYSYALGACAGKPAIKCVGINETLSVLTSDGSLQKIASGDYIVGDRHGIVRIPTEGVDLEHLIRYIEKSVEADELVMEDIRAGRSVKEAKAAHRASLKQYI